MNTELALVTTKLQYPPIPIWWSMVADLRCLITRRPNPTLHHIHSGSVGDIGVHSGTAIRGVNDYLVIPLAQELHVLSGTAIDGSIGVRTWETRFGTQVDLMDEVCRRTGVNAWKAAGIKRDPWDPSASSASTQA